ncbi:IS200/IS605 family transposase [Paremcibacter congregatus]|uniref:IS200/IS605 family transposase n=1 Tax=Paremcibacter congregatus TaxID=2043170 RepID=A0A2G4YR51_9PROT|nr:IS200/IS605 family transposase [Paremcibacter congregatus]PHZ84788.1 IS200/IS605 family transposase [Paremcibacter congregatus]QDE26240.1 IS200/IS605 family transposase [Paremcibacter congregatus]
MPYDKGCHTVFHHRYHLVWITKYRFKVLRGTIRERIREIIWQVCDELGVTIINGVLSSDHVHMFVSIPPHHAVSNVMRKVKGRSSRKIQMEYPELRKRYWGRHFWARGYFCSTSGLVTDDIILQYIDKHAPKPTDVSR